MWVITPSSLRQLLQTALVDTPARVIRRMQGVPEPQVGGRRGCEATAGRQVQVGGRRGCEVASGRQAQVGRRTGCEVVLRCGRSGVTLVTSHAHG